MAIGLPFVKLGAIAMKQATKPIVKFLVRATRHPHRQNYRSVRAAKALYIMFGRISVRGSAALAAEQPPAMTDDQLLDAGVELLLEVAAYVVAACILFGEYKKSVVKEAGLKDVARRNEERITALEKAVEACHPTPPVGKCPLPIPSHFPTQPESDGASAKS